MKKEEKIKNKKWKKLTDLREIFLKTFYKRKKKFMTTFYIYERGT